MCVCTSFLNSSNLVYYKWWESFECNVTISVTSFFLIATGRAPTSSVYSDKGFLSNFQSSLQGLYHKWVVSNLFLSKIVRFFLLAVSFLYMLAKQHLFEDLIYFQAVQFLQRLQIVKRERKGWVWRITATFRQSSLNMFTHDMFAAPRDVSNQSKWLNLTYGYWVVLLFLCGMSFVHNLETNNLGGLFLCVFKILPRRIFESVVSL